MRPTTSKEFTRAVVWTLFHPRMAVKRYEHCLYELWLATSPNPIDRLGK